MVEKSFEVLVLSFIFLFIIFVLQLFKNDINYFQHWKHELLASIIRDQSLQTQTCKVANRNIEHRIFYIMFTTFFLL